MLYFYPFFTFGSVELNHYNIWADNLQAEGVPLKNQNSAFGMGIGMGYRVQHLELGMVFSALYTSATSNLVEDYYFKTLTHRLLNFLIHLPVGINYPLTEQFSVYLGVKPMMGLSYLTWYDSLQVSSYGFSYYEILDASLNAYSFGLGFDFGGDFAFSSFLALYVRFGYDVINFKGYQGEYEERTPERIQTKVAYLIFDMDDGEFEVRDKPYNPSAGEKPGEENLSGFRFSLGIKLGIGR